MGTQGDSTESGTETAEVATWTELFAVPGVGLLFLVQALSTWGDYIARLAVAAVVYAWTQSPLATATTLAVSLLPAVFGRSLLSPWSTASTSGRSSWGRRRPVACWWSP